MKFSTEDLTTSVQEAKKFPDKILKAAQYYAKCGIPVIPLLPSQKILPPRRTGMNYQSASANIKTVSKWFSKGGPFEGYNIGIACGRENGVFVIDIDTHGGDGARTWTILTEKHGPVEGVPVQNTPRGGRHLLFSWAEGANTTTGKLGEAVDTRGGTISRYVSHVVAYPSETSDGKYAWEPTPGIELRPPPDWVLKTTGRPEEESSDEMETQVSLEQIQRMLTAIPASVENDDWVRIGMAIHSQHPGGDGMDIWDEWSQTTDIDGQYDRDMLKARWRSFKAGGRIRIGSLFHFAREHGWEPTDEDSIKEVRNMQLDMLNADHAMVVVGSRARVIREVDPLDKISPHYIIMPIDDFKMVMSNEFITNGHNEKPRPLADAWIRWKYRNTYPLGMGMFPSGDKEGWYNTWNGFAYEAKEGDWSKLYGHVREVICGGKDTWAEWVLDWMADAIQNPENPPGTAIVMRGDEGVGKGTLADKFGRLFGYHYRHLSNDAHLTGNFNAHMMDALFVFADEITWGGNKKTSGVLKGLVTERHLLGERKNVDAVSYRNMVRLMIASNSDWVVPADISSRRWFVLDVPNEKRNDFDYFGAIEDEFDNGGAEAMMHFLQNREIKANLRKAPETEALAHQRSQSMPSSLMWWNSILEKGTIEVPFQDMMDLEEMQTGESKKWPTEVSRSAMLAAYEEWALHRNIRPMSGSTFYQHMKRMGMKDTRPTREGIRARHWLVPEYDEAVAILARQLGIKTQELI